MDNIQPFFEIRGEEALPVGILCVSMTEEIMEREEETRLLPEYMEAFQTLKNKLFAINEDRPENIPLTVKESFAFQHAFVQVAYHAKGHLLLSPEERKTTDADPEIEETFELLEEYAPDLLWRITQRLGYNDYGLDALEEVFDIKTGVVRKLEVDNSEEFSTIAISVQNENPLRFSFDLINLLQYYHEESDFARKICENQFVNMHDFRALFPKISSIKCGAQLSLTMRETIILYWVISLTQYIFVTEIADIIESIEKSITIETYRQIRSFALQYYAVLLDEMQKVWKDNPDIFPYFNKVREWDI